MIDFAKLTAPFDADKIEWRVGSMTKDKSKGMAMAYIDARDVMERLDAVCGPDGWQNRYSHAEGKTICEIGIRCGEEWVWKADGAGDTDFEKEKGALSAAFKRAAVRWGVGRYLYDVPSLWVRVDQYKKIEKDEYPRLRKLLGGEGIERSNGSTRPPAKQHISSMPHDKDSDRAGTWDHDDSVVPVEALIERVAMAQTFQALKATKGHEGFRHDCLALDKAGRSKVEAAIAEKEAMFGMGAG